MSFRYVMAVLLFLCACAGAAPETGKAETRKPPRLRDPFWPVDYWPEVMTVTTNALAKPDWPAAEKELKRRIKIVARVNRRNLACVNHQWVHVAEEVTLDFQGRIYIWKVRSISIRESAVEFDQLTLSTISTTKREHTGDRSGS